MKNKNTFFLFSIATVICALAIFLGFIFSTNTGESVSEITLPEKSQLNLGGINNILRENIRIIEEMGIDTGNIKEVLKLLKRPSEYSFSSETRIFSNDKLSSKTHQGNVKDSVSKVTLLDVETPINHTIISKDSIYTWKNGSKTYKKLGKGSFSYDDISGIPTYENLLSYDDFIDAFTIQEDNEIFLFVRVQNPLSQLDEEYKISMSTGLLVWSAFKNGIQTVSEFSLTALDLSPIDTSIFTLPDRKNITE